MPTLYEWAGGKDASGRLIDGFEWGTRLAQHNSQPGAELVERAPVPRWGWGEAPPYQP